MTSSRARLRAVQPFDFELSRRAMAGFAPRSDEQRIDPEAVRAVIECGGRAVVVDVTSATGGVDVEFHADQPLDAPSQAAAELAVRRWLSLDDDPKPFLAIADTDPAMADVLAETRGLHQVRFTGVAEGAAYFVLTHRTSQAVASGRKRRLAAAYGPTLDLDGETWTAFPTLDRVAGLSVGELAAFTATLRQAEYLSSVCQRLAELGEESLYRLPFDELMPQLLAIRGVGEFTAQAIALRVLGHPNPPPPEMPAFTAAVEALYGPGARLADVVRRYGDQAGLWGYHARTGLGSLERDGRRATARRGPSGRTPPRRRPAG